MFFLMGLILVNVVSWAKWIFILQLNQNSELTDLEHQLHIYYPSARPNTQICDDNDIFLEQSFMVSRIENSILTWEKLFGTCQ